MSQQRWRQKIATLRKMNEGEQREGATRGRAVGIDGLGEITGASCHLTPGTAKPVWEARFMPRN